MLNYFSENPYEELILWKMLGKMLLIPYVWHGNIKFCIFPDYVSVGVLVLLCHFFSLVLNVVSTHISV
jgi:hypothetical protein